jgi:hypothetical protein
MKDLILDALAMEKERMMGIVYATDLGDGEIAIDFQRGARRRNGKRGHRIACSARCD